MRKNRKIVPLFKGDYFYLKFLWSPEVLFSKSAFGQGFGSEEADRMYFLRAKRVILGSI